MADWSDADRALLQSVYELQCTTRMNALYYEKRLSQIQFMSFWMEILVATTASGSGIASVISAMNGAFASVAQAFWLFVGLLSAAAAIIRPVFAPGKKIEAFTRQAQGYRANFFALKKIAFLARQEGRISDDHRKRYDTVFDRHVQLSNEDEISPKRRLVEAARAMTARKLPFDGFWFPAVADAPGSPQPAGEASVSVLPSRSVTQITK